MRTIEWTPAFKRDYTRIKSTPRHKDIENLLPEMASLLTGNRPLAEKHRDHGLGRNSKRRRERHLRPDLLLIHKLPDEGTLCLMRLDSLSGLFAK